MNVFQRSEHNQSLDDLDEESHALLPVDELLEDVQEPPQAVKCGGEDGEAGGTGLERQSLNVDVPGRSSSGRGRGKVAPAGNLDSMWKKWHKAH